MCDGHGLLDLAGFLFAHSVGIFFRQFIAPDLFINYKAMVHVVLYYF